MPKKLPESKYGYFFVVLKFSISENLRGIVKILVKFTKQCVQCKIFDPELKLHGKLCRKFLDIDLRSLNGL